MLQETITFSVPVQKGHLLQTSYREKWVEEKLYELVPMIEEWNIRNLELWDTKQPKILKQITPISFPHLRFLQLYQNDISSIENLSRLHVPSLVNCNLRENKINYISVLRKVYWPHCKQLVLAKNPIFQFTYCTWLSTDNLTSLILESPSWRREDSFLASLVKMNLPLIKRLYFTINGRKISEKSVCEQMKKKWKGVELRDFPLVKRRRF